ncbi:M48 family metallopeptidase [Ferrimonas lipolytica]|uniref:M48 family metalloprotease n=1 Tax=Ferrimonas lipolytica TaxID=2724191 RepID=A0A6H1UAS7_9GAMM|nr:M48 family metallopeptidase [Ferrimonas lipolytica]QIZ76177.1 M48 family metalloprotease [Ferrimonas lipolytica]
MSQFVNRPTPENNHKSGSPLPDFFILVAGVGLAISVVVLLINLAIGQLGQFIPFSWEQRLAPAWSAQRVESPAQRQMDELLARLLAVKPMQDDIDVKVTLIEDEQINAFAGLGGEIVIFSGLIEALPSENALAMVVAHELAHVRQRHVIKSLSKNLSITGLSILLGIENQALLQLSSQFTMLSFSRDDEAEADQLALAAVVALYGHSGGVTALFDVLENGNSSSWLSSHPSNEARRAATQVGLNLAQPLPLSADYLDFKAK